MIEHGQPEGGYILSVGERQVPFRIDYRDRKSLLITVHPNLRLEVVAPKGSTQEQVLPRVQKRASWILRQLRYFEQYQPAQPSPRFVSGETILYLGRQYRLKVQQSSADSVKLIGRYLHVWTSERADSGRIQLQVEHWYREHADRIFANRIRLCLEKCVSLKLAEQPQLSIRKLTHRWGSCTKSGRVILNLDLIKAPIHCIDYVIVHELCHRQIHNHSSLFYRLLGRCMPDWEARKSRLESFVV